MSERERLARERAELEGFNWEKDILSSALATQSWLTSTDNFLKVIADPPPHVVTKVAKAGHNAMFEENFDDLHPNSIDHAIWESVARAAIAAFLEEMKK